MSESRFIRIDDTFYNLGQIEIVERGPETETITIRVFTTVQDAGGLQQVYKLTGSDAERFLAALERFTFVG